MGESSMWGAVGRLVSLEGRCVRRVGLGKVRPRGWASGRGGSRGCAGAVVMERGERGVSRLQCRCVELDVMSDVSCKK